MVDIPLAAHLGRGTGVASSHGAGSSGECAGDCRSTEGSFGDGLADHGAGLLDVDSEK